MSRVTMMVGVLLALIGAGMITAPPSHAQEPVRLDAVEPSEGRPGQQLELTLHGGGFGGAGEVRVVIGGVEVLEARIVSDEMILARVFIPENAQPGPRPVEVVAVFGPNEQFSAGLEAGFFVLEPEGLPPGAEPSPVPPPPPPPPPNGNWLWILIGAGLIGLGAIIGHALTLRTQLTWEQTAQLQWQLEASTELPEPKEACTWICKAEVSTDLLHWAVTALVFTPLPLPSGRPIADRRVEGKTLEPLNEASRLQYALEDEAQTLRRIVPVIDASIEQIMAWKKDGQTPASIKVEAHLKRDIKCEFKLYHCENTSEGLSWVERMKWKRSLRQPGGEYLGVLRGPTAGEPDFVGRARRDLEGFLLKLIKGVRFRL